MTWTLLVALVIASGLAALAALARRAELARMERGVRSREKFVSSGAQKTLLRQPVVDLTRCLGCGSCVAACPEDNVLELVHGQAVVVNGARCVGHAACERECPVGAITVTLANLAERRDVPVLAPSLEALGAPGLFLAGEVTAHALIKTAIEHGTQVAREVASRCATPAPALPSNGAPLDLCIVGAGPAGLACALEAKRHGLRFVVIDQASELGGTVAKYPRRKLVITQPVELPLYGALRRESYTKEELVELWQSIARQHELPIRAGCTLLGVERFDDGYVVRTSGGELRAANVCLAVGRRGAPNKLGVAGEELAKVSYSLLDAHSYAGRRVLVVGGGDSAVEAAVALAEQPDAHVTLSYRKSAFFRLRARNEQRLAESVQAGRLTLLLESEVAAISTEHVELNVRQDGEARALRLENDEVFVMAGGAPPFPLLERAGVSFDPALRAPAAPLAEQGAGLSKALAVGFAMSSAALAWALWHFEYYSAPAEIRALDPRHALLRPGRAIGLGLGLASTAMIVVNLLYLARRSQAWRIKFGSLQSWMTSHIATGILALLCALVHAGLTTRDSVGGHALWALAALLVTGAVGRYFYAYVPRAANGRELELQEVRDQLARFGDEWDKGQRAFVERVQIEIADLIRARQWRSSFLGRVLALVGGQRELARRLAKLADDGRAQGVPPERVASTLHLARKAHRTALAAAHFEDLRAILGTWRYLHRWVAVLMLVLLVAHVAYALIYGQMFAGDRS
jgi:thioredoxin reductase/NAD-dependent dihydropyrimidine dehydrogenase PreA subunit